MLELKKILLACAQEAALRSNCQVINYGSMGQHVKKFLEHCGQ